MRKERIKDARLNVLDYVIALLVVILVSYIFCVIVGFILLKAEITSLMYVLSHRYVLLGTFLIACVLFVPFIFVAHTQMERNYVMRRLMSMRQAVEGNLENSHFMTAQEMTKNGYKVLNSLEELKTQDDGILLSFSEGKKNNVKVIISPEVIHTLVIGTTGSGKTAGYLIPSIKALANTKTKPSFLFTDPKGEINEKTAWYLKEQGYDVLVMDFRRPERSLRWNPLAPAYEKYQRAQTIAEEMVYQDGKYYFNGQYYTAETIEEAERVEEQRLEDEAFEDIQNVVYSLCPVNPKDPIWDNGARSLIQAVILAMLEDSTDIGDMTIDKFCFYNVAKICSKTDNNCEEIKNYFKYRKRSSLAVQYSGMVLNAPDKQMGSYLSSVAEKLTLFNDRGICNVTSGQSEIDVSIMDEKPTAIYLILPDEKVGRHALGSLFIAEAYKKLVEKAVKNGGRLKRNVYFMMDEFGNMPKIDNVGSMFTVGRSRGIIQMPVIQSYSQVVEKYGVETAKTIFGNCNTEIFIGAKDDDTCERFSKKLGNYTVMSTNVSGMKRGWEHNYSESLKERPLMYPRELTLLNNKNDLGNVIVINQGYSPTLGKFTPYFKSKIFENKTVIDEGLIPRSLDEEQVYYNFTERFKQIENDMNEIAKIEPTEEVVEEPTEEPTEEPAQEESKVMLESIMHLQTLMAMTSEFEISENPQENLKKIDEIIAVLREQRSIVKLNQALRLKTQYEKAIEKENENIDN